MSMFLDENSKFDSIRLKRNEKWHTLWLFHRIDTGVCIARMTPLFTYDYGVLTVNGMWAKVYIFTCIVGSKRARRYELTRWSTIIDVIIHTQTRGFCNRIEKIEKKPDIFILGLCTNRTTIQPLRPRCRLNSNSLAVLEL